MLFISILNLLMDKLFDEMKEILVNFIEEFNEDVFFNFDVEREIENVLNKDGVNVYKI